MRLVTLISVSLHLHDVFSYLGDIVSSFEAGNLERASRSNAKTGFGAADDGKRFKRRTFLKSVLAQR